MSTTTMTAWNLTTLNGVGETMSQSKETVWPDELEMGDRVEFDGHTYIVTGTGPAEASLERVDDPDVTGKVFRWAFTNNVEFEFKKTLDQEDFGRCVATDENFTKEQNP